MTVFYSILCESAILAISFNASLRCRVGGSISSSAFSSPGLHKLKIRKYSLWLLHEMGSNGNQD